MALPHGRALALGKGVKAMGAVTSTGPACRPAAIAAALVFAASLVAAARAQAASSSALPPITSSRHGSFVPKVGDWEGTVGGYPASFELVYAPEYAALGRPSYGYEDLTTLDPSSCPLAANEYSVGVVGDEEPTPLGPGGSFPLAAEGIGGGIAGSSSATLSSSFATGSRRAGCVGTLTRAMHPATRRTVQKGPWTLRFSDGESDSFQVTAGGRAATGIDFPPGLARCGGPRGNLNLFINATGAARLSGPRGSFVVALKFKGPRRASGRMTAPGSRCGVLSLAASLSAR